MSERLTIMEIEMSKSKDITKTPFDPSEGWKSRKVPLVQVARNINKRLKIKKPNTSFNYKDVLKFDWVPVKKCILNYDRQRYPEPTHIEKLLIKWNIICATPLQARYSKEEDLYYIADGQQHGIGWVLQYGEDSLVPVCYVESEDENIESIQLLALNTDSEPMAKYFIHKQKCIMGDAESIALENTVVNAGCSTGYNKRAPGVITLINDLLIAQKDYGLEDLGKVLSFMRRHFPTEKIHTANMLGFLKVKELLTLEQKYSDTLFEDIFNASTDYFDAGDALHNNIKREFEILYPTNYRGMGVREKVASGIISIYEKIEGKELCSKPFNVDMPYNKNIPNYDPSTYHTWKLYRTVCKTEDFRPVWAHKNADKWGVEYNDFLPLCHDTCSCCGSELDYGLGKNNNNKLDENTPSTDHRIPRSKGGTNDVTNLQVICMKCNTLKSNSTPDDIPRYKKIIEMHESVN